MKTFLTFIAGLAAGILLMLGVYFLFVTNAGEQGSALTGESNVPLAPQDLVPGAQEFGTLVVTITSGGAAVSGVEVDVGERPGGSMAVVFTDQNGTALFEDMPTGDFVIFFNDNTFPKQFERVSSLIPVHIVQGETVERDIELVER